MERMQDRNPPDQRAACISGPIEGVDMEQIELVAALLKLQEKLQEEIGLGEETGVGASVRARPGEAGRLHARGHGNALNVYALDARTGACEERDLVAAFLQLPRQVGQQRLRAADIRLRNRRDKRGDQTDSHSCPR